MQKQKFNMAKYRQLVDDRDGARSKVDALSHERNEMIKELHWAKATVEAAERFESGARSDRYPPPAADVERARYLLEKWESLNQRRQAASKEAGGKAQLVAKLTEFLLKKGVRHPEVIEQDETTRIGRSMQK